MEIEQRQSFERRTESQSRSANRNLQKAQKLNDWRNKYGKFFMQRNQGQKMTLSDAAWILNTFAQMRCDPLFYKLTKTDIIMKVAEWCGTGTQTVTKLLEFEGFYVDQRYGPLSVTKTIPDIVKDIIMLEIQSCLEKGIPCTSKYLQDVFADLNYVVCRRSIRRALADWGIVYGKLKASENRKERMYVQENLNEYFEKISINDDLPFTCMTHKKCKCPIRKEIIYLDESYIHQNHVNKYGYYIPELADRIKKPTGRGLRIVIAAALTVDGWLGIETYDGNEISRKLRKPQKDDSHSYGSIKYWIAQKGNKDYHKNFNQEIFLDYFENNILANLTAPSILVMDNASYHHFYDKMPFSQEKH